MNTNDSKIDLLDAAYDCGLGEHVLGCSEEYIIFRARSITTMTALKLVDTFAYTFGGKYSVNVDDWERVTITKVGEK